MVDEKRRSCKLIFVQGRRGDKKMCWRKEGAKNSFRNAFPQLVGQLPVRCRPTDCPPTGDRTILVPFPECFIFIRSTSVGQPTGDRTTSVRIPECCFPILMEQLALSQHLANRPVQCRLADGQPTCDRPHPEFLKGKEK